MSDDEDEGRTSGHLDDHENSVNQDTPDGDAEPPSYEEHFALLTHTGDTPPPPVKPRPTPYPRGSRPTEAQRTPANEPPRSASGLKNTGKVLLALLSIIALTATGYAYATLDNLQSGVNTTDALNSSGGAPPADDGAKDILLVGTDARTDMQGNPLPDRALKALRTEQKDGVNTDTVIILRLPKNGGKPSAVSIPRDSWVDVPKGGKDKINSAFGDAKIKAAESMRHDGKNDPAEIERDSDQEGRKALVKTVQDLTNVHIDHYAEVSLLGFYLLTEALDGVDVCLNQPTVDKDSGADFPAGVQKVSGGEALSFVRQRKNLPRGDLDRIVRQQSFLASALHKVMSAGTLTSPSKLGELNSAVHQSLVLDPNLDILEFAQQTKGIASGDVKFLTVPTGSPGGRSEDGQSVVQVDRDEVRKYMAGIVQQEGTGEPAMQPKGGGSSPAANTGPAGAAAPHATAPITADGVSCVN